MRFFGSMTSFAKARTNRKGVTGRLYVFSPTSLLVRANSCDRVEEIGVRSSSRVSGIPIGQNEVTHIF